MRTTDAEPLPSKVVFEQSRKARALTHPRGGVSTQRQGNVSETLRAFWCLSCFAVAKVAVGKFPKTGAHIIQGLLELQDTIHT